MSIKNSIEKSLYSLHNKEMREYFIKLDYKDDYMLTKRITKRPHRADDELVIGALERRFNHLARRIIKTELRNCEQKCKEIGIEMPFSKDLSILVVSNQFDSSPKTCSQFWERVKRLAGWIRASSEMPELLKQLRHLLIGKNCLSCYNALSSAPDFLRWSPGALMRHINSIIWRANQILEPSKVRVSWAGVRLALKMGNRKRGKAAVIAAAGTFLGEKYCNYGASVRPYSYFRDTLSQYLCSSKETKGELKMKSKIAHLGHFQVFEAVKIKKPYLRERKTVLKYKSYMNVQDFPARSLDSRYYYAYYSSLGEISSAIERACEDACIEMPSSIEEEAYHLEVKDLLSTLPDNCCPIMYRSDILEFDMPGLTQAEIDDLFKFASEHSNLNKSEHNNIIGLEHLFKCSGYDYGQIAAIGMVKFRAAMRGNSDIYC